MNLSLAQIEGGLLLVPQFTLVADTRKEPVQVSPGRRRASGKELFDHFLACASESHARVAGVYLGRTCRFHLPMTDR